MIRNKQDYLRYLERDKIALGYSSNRFSLKEIVAPNLIWRFQRKLRRYEYHKNNKGNFIQKLLCLYLKWDYRRFSIKLGFSIPPNVFGPGLAIVHLGTIIVNGRANVGENCRLHPGVVIGASGGEVDAPNLGNNIYIGPGAKIFGKIQLSNNIAVSANSVVNKSFFNENVVIGGIPAKELKNIDIRKIIKHLDSNNS